MRKNHALSAIMVVVAAIALTFAACKKEEDPPKLTRTQMLTGKYWIMTAYTVDPAYDMFGMGTATTNVYSQMLACSKDDKTLYNADGTGVDDEGATKCNSSDPQTKPITWSFNADQTILTTGTESYTVMNLSTSELKLRNTFEDGGTTYTVMITFGH